MAQSLLRLVPKPGEIVQGKATLRRKDGGQVDILALEPNSAELRGIRGAEIGIVFQDPKISFSPVHTVGSQISEMVRAHIAMSKREVREYVIDLLNRVGISNPRQRFEEYPHQLSGGMSQRAMIAMALSCKPLLLIADEATTALDVTIQAQILELLKVLQEEEGLSAIYITHNLGVVAEQVDRVYVMYLGRVVETATTERLFARPLHPYTQKLLQSAPRPGQRAKRLEAIEGSVPSGIGRPVQCGFYSRCPSRLPKCEQTVPALVEVEDGHQVRCFLHNAQEEQEDDWTFVGVP